MGLFFCYWQKSGLEKAARATMGQTQVNAWQKHYDWFWWATHCMSQTTLWDGGVKWRATMCRNGQVSHAGRTYIEGAARKWRTETSPKRMTWEEVCQRGGRNSICKNLMQCFYHITPMHRKKFIHAFIPPAVKAGGIHEILQSAITDNRCTNTGRPTDTEEEKKKKTNAQGGRA